MSSALLACGGGPAMANIVAQSSAIDEMVGSIVACGEANRKVVETMAILASGKAELAGRVTIHDLFDLEDRMMSSSLSLGQGWIDEVTKHRFADGIYIREIIAPKNCMISGAIHKTDHLCVMASGDISILTVDGIKRMRTPFVINSQRGVKRFGFAHEDTVWMDVHPNPTNERDPEKLWEMFYHNNRPE